MFKKPERKKSLFVVLSLLVPPSCLPLCMWMSAVSASSVLKSVTHVVWMHDNFQSSVISTESVSDSSSLWTGGSRTKALWISTAWMSRKLTAEGRPKWRTWLGSPVEQPDDHDLYCSPLDMVESTRWGQHCNAVYPSWFMKVLAPQMPTLWSWEATVVCALRHPPKL